MSLGLFSFFHIRLNIKVCKESEEKGPEKQEEGDVDLGIVAVHEERGGGVDTPGDELHQLQHWVQSDQQEAPLQELWKYFLQGLFSQAGEEIWKYDQLLSV